MTLPHALHLYQPRLPFTISLCSHYPAQHPSQLQMCDLSITYCSLHCLERKLGILQRLSNSLFSHLRVAGTLWTHWLQATQHWAMYLNH